MKIVASIAVSSHAERHSTYLNVVKIRYSYPNIFKLNALYESDDESLLGYSTGDNEIENGHQSVYTVEYSSARPISSREDSDAEDEWN